MARRKTDRLWKLEDSYNKVDIYVSAWAREPQVDALNCEILVSSRTFSGEYTAVLEWADVWGFARECANLSERMETDAAGPPAFYSPGDEPRLSIRAEPAGQRRVFWEVVCRPVLQELEVLSFRFATEYQLLNGISTGAERIWQRWPGPTGLRPAL